MHRHTLGGFKTVRGPEPDSSQATKLKHSEQGFFYDNVAAVLIFTRKKSHPTLMLRSQSDDAIRKESLQPRRVMRLIEVKR